jgi:ribose/xylose/arabinose/galactoside ABC-type transport system permease subunit
MTATTTPPTPAPAPAPQPAGKAARSSRLSRLVQLVLVERVALLVALLAIVVVWFYLLGQNGYLTATYDSDYLAASLDSFVPLCILALAELIVMVSGRGGIDLSVGSIVSLSGMAFGFLIGKEGWPLLPAILVTVLGGALLGAINGVLIAYVGFPALIATLATYYAYGSIALISNDNAPISTKPVQDVHSLTQGVDVAATIPDFPLQLLTFLLPVVVVVWLVLNRTTYGRKLYAVGTNDVASRFANIDVRQTRFRAYTASGVLSGIAAVVIVAQFASARPDAGSVGNGMALPAITIAVLGGVVVSGGVGRVAGVVVAALLVTWLNAGILLAFEGSDSSQFQLFALGALLVLSALLNAWSLRRARGAS